MMHLLIYRDTPIGIYSSAHLADVAAKFVLANGCYAEYIDIRKIEPDKIYDVDVNHLDKFLRGS